LGLSVFTNSSWSEMKCIKFNFNAKEMKHYHSYLPEQYIKT
jgi:hypothetical protein